MSTPYGPVPQREHYLVLELLPWYSKGTLSPAEHALTCRHLEQCPVCRTALEHCQGLGQLFASRGETAAWQPSEAHFERLLTRIDAAGPENSPEPPARQRHSGPRRLAAGFGDAPPALRWLLGMETLALAALALFLTVPRPAGELLAERTFETLTRAAGTPAETPGPRLRVVFAGEITETEIRGLLQAIQGQLVAGPSPIGVYTVELDPRSAALEPAMNFLRSSAKVRLAEPLRGGAAP